MDFSPADIVAIKLSLRVATVATLASLPVGLAVAMLLARGRFPGRTLVDGIVHLPLVLPPVVTGYLLLIGFGRRGPIGAFLEQTFGLTFAFRWTGAALASAVMAFPLLVRAIRLSIEAVDQGLEDAAASLGARRSVLFATVTLPLILPGLLAGAVLCFAKALGEFGATITFVSNIPGETQTIPTAIYTALQAPGGEPTAIRLSIVAILVSLAALLASEVLARRIRRARVAP
jgi:molybdate transport system permease protein